MRNWTAVHAFNRAAGPMHDRRAPRGGAGRDPEVEEALQDLAEDRAVHTASTTPKTAPRSP